MPEEVELSRNIGLLSVTMIGVGAMIGAGIFVLTGIAAGTAGPGLVLAFVLNGVVTIFTAMVYAELGSAIPEAGGGYIWVKEALPSANGFLSGWMSWFAHAVAGSLYALGFGAYFGLFLSTFGISVFGLEGVLLHKFLAVIVALIFILINFKGVSETGAAANIVAIVKIVILAIFIASGLYAMYYKPNWIDHFSPFLPNGMSGVFMAMGLTFIAFEGYEVIAQTGEEVINPKKNIPRAVFLSLAIVIPIYILVAITALGALNAEGMATWQFLGLQKELGLVEAAKQFMPFGTTLLLFGGLVSTMSALNATTFSSTRVSFAMGRDFNLPAIFKKVHPINKTPYSALIISGALIIFMAIALPIEDVASAADIMFLLLFLQVNIAVINIRKKWGDKLDYGYKMPLFPYVPIAGIISKMFLAIYMFYYSPVAWYATLIWIGLGIAVYFFYSIEKEEVEKAKVEREAAPEEYRAIAALANPEYVEPLMKIAGGIAKIHKSELVALHVVEVPYQTFLHSGKQFIKDREPMLDAAVQFGENAGVSVKKKVLISHDAASAIVDFAAESKGGVIVMGWTGKIYQAKVKRSIPNKVMKQAPCDVCVVHARKPGEIKRILLPAGLGEHASRVRFSDDLARAFNAELTILTILEPGTSSKLLERVKEMHEKEIALCKAKTKSEIAQSPSYGEFLIARSEDYDLLIIGPSKEWILGDALFGSVPDRIANEARCTVLMLKEPEAKAESWASLLLKKIMP